MVEQKVRQIMLVGHYPLEALECSYHRALEALGCEVHRFDIVTAIQRHVPLGSVGRLFNAFVPVEPWIRKASRDLALQAIKIQPDLVLTFGHYPIRIGAVFQLRASTNATLVHVWPDPMVNWNNDLTACLPLYDLVATYSQATVPVFERLGARRAVWVPLAGDPALHADIVCTDEDRRRFSAQVTFIGGWRPEREALLSQLGDFDLKIWGPDWGRRCRGNRVIMRAWQNRPIYGADFAKVVQCTQVNLNIIDPNNYPAANMRFFEIPVAGGLQVSSACPEMEGEFAHGVHLFYYEDAASLSNLVPVLLKDRDRRKQVAVAANAKVLSAHTYEHRVQQLVEFCDQLAESKPADG